MTDLTKYARDLKRKQEDTERPYRRKVEDFGFEEGTRDSERALQQFRKASNSYPSDIPKLVSLRAAKEDEISAKDAAPPKRDFSKMQFLDDGMKKGGKVNLKDCKISTHVPSKKHGNW